MKHGTVVLVLSVHYSEKFDSEEIAQVLGNWAEMLPPEYRTFIVNRGQLDEAKMMIEEAVACTFIPEKKGETEH